MLNNKQLLAIAAALFTQEALALNVHRHVHNHAHDKKAVVYQETDVVTVTDWSTVTVWEEYSASSSTSSQKTMYKGGAHTHHTLSSSTTTTTSSSSSSSSSIPTSSSVLSTSSSVAPTTSSLVPTTSSTFSTSTTPSTTPVSSTLTTSYVAPTSSAVAVASSSSAVVDKADAIEIEAITTTPTTTSVAAAATSTSTTAAAAATTASSSTSSSSGKRGLAYNTGSLLSNFLGTGTKVTWSYNWGMAADSDAPSDLEYVPMLWSPAKASGWASAAETAIENGSKYFLSFNECDNAGQCNTDAATAATAHQEYMNPYSSSVKIGTPAITNSVSEGEGVSWLSSFLSACDGNCDYDFCPIHWYNTADTDNFLNHLLDVYATCGKDIWITEFAPTGTDSEINSFLVDVMDQMDNNSTFSFVTRYAYFWAATGSLLTSETTLSEYGNTFAYE